MLPVRRFVPSAKQCTSGAQEHCSLPAQSRSTENSEANPVGRGESGQPATAASGKGASPQSEFPKRASWLKDQLLERGWSNSDPSKYRGPDRKTIEKILRGETVRNDVIEKLAVALSSKSSKVRVLDIPRD